MQPNIVCILLDTVRADHLSSYGYHRQTTPFIDTLAQNGAVYERAYSNSIWTLPAYASLFTGQYPSQHKAVNWNRQIVSNTLVDGLNERGYATLAASSHAISGKYGIADAFDRVRWIPVSSRDVLFSPDPLFEELDDKRERGVYDSALEKYGDAVTSSIRQRSPRTLANGLFHVFRQVKQRYGWWDDDGASEIVDAGIELVSDTTDPFFLFMNFIEPHAPYRPPRKYIYEYLDGQISIDQINRAMKWFLEVTLGQVEITPAEKQILIDLYDAEIRYLDGQLQRFWESLPESVRDETVVIVCADHGDLFGEWGIWGHQGKIHHSLCRIPLIVSTPWSTHRRERTPVELREIHDFVHRTADASTGEIDLEPRGEAIIEYFGLDTQLGFAPWEKYDDVDEEQWNRYQVSLVSEDRRAYWEAGRDLELYDPWNDPSEETDLAPTEPEIASQSRDRIRAVVGDPEALHQEYRQATNEPVEMDRETEQHLKDLGYM